MKINNRSNKKLKIIIAVIVAVAVVVAVGAFFIFKDNGKLFGWTPITSDQGSVNYNPPSKEELEGGNQAKDATVKNDSDNPKTNPENEGDSTTTPTSQTSITITAANQNGQTLQIRTLVEAVSTSGTCTLTLTKDAKTVTKTAGVQALASSSTCKGFDVPVSELSPGTWTVAVTYKNTNTQGSATQQVTIQ